MIKFSNSDKTLTVISGLGNFPSNAGGGSDVTRQDVVNIVNSAITEYDTENQADLEEIREDVSGNTEDIAAHGAALADIRSDVDALSGTARDIRWNVDSISARTIANTADISALSAATEGIEGTVRSVVSDVAAVSGQTSANTADIAALSGVVETNELAISNLENYTQNELAPAIGGIGTNLTALSGQVETLSSSTVNGLETAQNAANSANTLASSAYTRADSAYTLASSAYTLAESLTGASGGPQVIFLNKLTQQERLALYNTINSYYDQNTQSFTSAWTEDLYTFYLDLRDNADQQEYQVNDQYEGFFPMQVTRVHPSDYGGAVFFCGVEGERNGNGHLVNIRFVITYDGQVDKGTWWIEPFQEPTQFDLYINNDGTIAQGQDWSAMGDSSKAPRIVMRYHNETQYGSTESIGRIKWSNIYPTTYNGETKMYWIWAADICVGTTMYSGVWGMIQDEWYSDSDVPPQLLQWTSGATYESQTYPPIS